MAATLEKELFDKRSYRRTVSGYDASRTYQVSGATNEQDAITASGIPEWGDAYGAGSPSSNMKVREITADPIGGSVGWFQVTVRWEWRFSEAEVEPVNGTELWEINGTGNTIHVDTCLSQTTFPATAEDPELSVGIDADGNVNGADIFEAVVTVSVRLWKTTSAIDTSYLGGVVSALQKVNTGSWYGLAAGEALFNRFRVAKTQDPLSEINFEFLGQRNISSGDIPEFLDSTDTQINVTSGKDGWQYLWTRPGKKPSESGSGGDTKNKFFTKSVSIANFYETSSFSALGLSGSLA